MKTLFTIFLFYSTLLVYSQTTFNYNNDFKKILSRTKNADDTLSYDKLIKRFTSNDTTMSDYEILCLLIGFTGKPDFRPYQDLETERNIYQMNGDEKYREALDSANIFLRTHPLSVKVIFEKSYSFHNLGQEDSAAFYMYKGQRIFEAMFFSGNGKSPDTPTFALGPADGQDYIQKFVSAKIGTMGSGRDKNGNFLDILEAKFDDGQTLTLNFIIQHATEKMFSPEEMKKLNDAMKK